MANGLADSFNINNNWQDSGTLSDQLIHNYGYNPIDARAASEEFANSGVNDFNQWAKDKGLDYKPGGTLGGESSSEGFMGTGVSGMDATKIGLGVGQLGLGLASYLDNKKTAEKQRKLLGQQIANNADLISRRKDRSANITKYFG